MLLVSSHLANYIPHQAGMVYRINMAWRESLDEIDNDIYQLPGDVFLDNPVGRSKPPNNRYTDHEVISLWDSYPEIVKYIAVSNIERAEQLLYYRNHTDAIIVPKIETLEGVYNVTDLFSDETNKMVMLDHDDLLVDMKKHGKNLDELYSCLVNPMINRCLAHGITVLRTAGVVFSDT